MEAMKTIPVGNGFAVVDDEDYNLVIGYCWHTNAKGYAVHSVWLSKSILMHRLIMNAPPGLEVDHINGNPLDNQRSNLRLASAADNRHNMRKHRGVSRYKGVTWDKANRRWRARITCNGRNIPLGRYDTELKAAAAYDAAALRLFGQFARPNGVLVL
jgi:hypothetical protein